MADKISKVFGAGVVIFGIGAGVLMSDGKKDNAVIHPNQKETLTYTEYLEYIELANDAVKEGDFQNVQGDLVEKLHERILQENNDQFLLTKFQQDGK